MAYESVESTTVTIGASEIVIMSKASYEALVAKLAEYKAMVNYAIDEHGLDFEDFGEGEDE